MTTSAINDASPRWGLTIPLTGVALGAHAEIVRALPSWGYTDVWSSEVAGSDAFTPLALASLWQPSLSLGTAIVPVFTRGPALIAQSAATMAAAAPGRFRLGIGASSETIVADWNGMDFDRPLSRTRDVLRFLRPALAGEKVSAEYDTFAVSGFRLENPPPEPPPVLLAALRPGMLALAGAEADGVILNWLAADDVAQCLASVANPNSDVVARIFVCPTEDLDYARTVGRRMIAAYLTVPAYAKFHRWLGRGEALGQMWTAWQAGDRRGALAAIPDEVVDALVLSGSPGACRDKVRHYRDAGVATPVIAVVPTPELTDADSLAATLCALGDEQEGSR